MKMKKIIEYFGDFIVKSARKALFDIKSPKYLISERKKGKGKIFLFRVFLSDINNFIIYKYKADNASSAKFFHKNTMKKSRLMKH